MLECSCSPFLENMDNYDELRILFSDVFGHVVHAQYGVIAWRMVGTYINESLVVINTKTRSFVEAMR